MGVGRTLSTTVTRADGTSGVDAVDVGPAFHAFVIAADCPSWSTVRIPQALDAVTGAELTEGLAFVAVGVRAANVVTLAVHAAKAGHGAVRVDQALVTLAVVEIAGGSGCTAIGVRAACRALRSGRLAVGVPGVAAQSALAWQPTQVPESTRQVGASPGQSASSVHFVSQRCSLGKQASATPHDASGPHSRHLPSTHAGLPASLQSAFEAHSVQPKLGMQP
jgi:hypothetical protein